MKAKLNFRGKIIKFEVEKCQGFKKYTGLMFKKPETSALLFENMDKKAIHSFFCPDFLAVWLQDNKIIDYKLISGNKPLIKSEKPSNKLLEIPLNKKYSEIIKLFLDDKEKDLNTTST